LSEHESTNDDPKKSKTHDFLLWDHTSPRLKEGNLEPTESGSRSWMPESDPVAGEPLMEIDFPPEKSTSRGHEMSPSIALF